MPPMPHSVQTHCLRLNPVTSIAPETVPGKVLKALLLIATLAAGPARATDTWCETVSPDFRLISDLPAGAQADLVTMLERFERVAEPFLPGEPVARRNTLKLVVFQRRNDFLALTGNRRFAGYMQPSLQTNRLLVGPVRGGLDETTLHEYAHYLLRNRTGVSLPMWFDEGLATLLGHTTFDREDALLGALPVRQLEAHLVRRPQTRTPRQRLSRTLKSTDMSRLPGTRINEFYDLSWLTTHYLYFNVYGDDLALDRIRGSDLDAFLHAGNQTLFEHLGQSPTQLLRQLKTHLKNWEQPRRVPAVAGSARSTDFHCLSDFERDLELARAIHVQNPARARGLLEPYLAAAEASPLPVSADLELRVVMARTDIAADRYDAAGRLLEHTLTQDPANAEAMVLTADLMVRDCLFNRDQTCQSQWLEAGTLYRSALRQDPTRYDGILGLGLAQLYSGRPGDAVNYLKVAYARVPWAAVVNYYLGESYRLLGDSRARIYLENTRNWAAEDIWRLLAEESLRLIGPSPESD